MVDEAAFGADIGDLTGVPVAQVTATLTAEPGSAQVVTTPRGPTVAESAAVVAAAAPVVAVSPPVVITEMARPAHPLPHARGAAPTITYDRFLPQLADQTQRQHLWQTLQAAMDVARTFVPGKALDIHSALVQPLRKSVSSTFGEGSWHSRGGVIMLEQHPGSTADNVVIETGVLLHECFHPTFYVSPFQDKRRGGTDCMWAEAWCDAFRYCAGMTILPNEPSELSWRPTAIGYSQTHTKAQVLASKSGWACIYRYPASLIINKAGGTLAGLQALWLQLAKEKSAARGKNVFDKFFGYSPRHPSGAAPVNNPSPPGTPDSPAPGTPAAVASAKAPPPPQVHPAIVAQANKAAASGAGAGPLVGVVAGAAVGSLAGPVGALIGAVIGGVAGNAATSK